MEQMQTVTSVAGLYVGYDLGSKQLPNLSIHFRPAQFATHSDYLRFASTIRLVVGQTWAREDPLANFPRFLADEVLSLKQSGYLKKGPQGWYV